jgi:hypothetical protein
MGGAGPAGAVVIRPSGHPPVETDPPGEGPQLGQQPAGSPAAGIASVVMPIGFLAN